MEVLVAVISAVLGWAASTLQHVLAQRAKIDESIRLERLPLYKEVWAIMRILPRWPKNETLRYSELINMSAELRDWYFTKGGIYLSDEALGAYRKLQDRISGAIRTCGNIEQRLTDSDYDDLVDLCRDLRGELTRDLLSRERVLLGMAMRRPLGAESASNRQN